VVEAAAELRTLLIEREYEWWRAIQVEDWDLARTFMRDDFSITTAGWIDAPIGREAWLESLATRYVLDAFEFDEVEARRYGDVAVIQCRSAQSGHFKESSEPWNGVFRYTDVWVLDGDESWRIAVRHAGMRR
jgi:ketosteroid isomerase-like protein